MYNRLTNENISGKVARKILGAIQPDVWNAYDEEKVLLKIQWFGEKFLLHLKETECRFNQEEKILTLL